MAEINGKPIDFLAIGDTVMDEFLQLKDAHVHCKIDSDACELCLRFGDKVPYESVTVIPAVGNSANAAVSAARLGLSTAFMTNVGDDENGQRCLQRLKEENIDTSFVKKEAGKKTNHHYVLWYDVDRTILIKHQSFERSWANYEGSEPPKWIYLSSLGEDSLAFHAEITEYLKKNPDVKLAFQPGTFQIKFGVSELKDIYERTEIFFSNVEEAETILNIQSKDILILSRGIAALGPKMVAISDGTNGAYFYMKQDGKEELWSVPLYPDPKPPFERTGAGDAFSSTFTAALALGKPPFEAFMWGPINSMSVVQQIGAQAGLLSREKLEEYLKNAPHDYKIKKMN